MDNINVPLSTSSTDSLIKQFAKNWWVLLIRGILLVFIGIYALTVPGITLASYCWVLGIFLMVDGMMALVLGFSHKVESRTWTIVRAFLTLLVGIFVVGHPLLIGAIVGVTLIIILAIHSLVSGSLEIYVAIRDRKEIQGEGWMILSGLFSVLFGVVLLSAPLLSVKVLIQVSGVFAILFGMVAIFTSFRFKTLKSS